MTTLLLICCATAQQIKSPVLFISVREQAGQEWISGKGTIVVTGDVYQLFDRNSIVGKVSTSIFGGKTLGLKKADRPERMKEFEVKTMTYYSDRLKKTFTLCPTNKTGSPSSLKLKWNTTIFVDITALDEVELKIVRQKHNVGM